MSACKDHSTVGAPRWRHTPHEHCLRSRRDCLRCPAEVVPLMSLWSSLFVAASTDAVSADVALLRGWLRFRPSGIRDRLRSTLVLAKRATPFLVFLVEQYCVWLSVAFRAA